MCVLCVLFDLCGLYLYILCSGRHSGKITGVLFMSLTYMQCGKKISNKILKVLKTPKVLKASKVLQLHSAL